MHRKVKFISLLLLFCIAMCFTADLAFTQFFSKTSPVSSSNKLYRLTEEDHLREIPVFGSSRAEKAYYCDSISSNCYNYGFPNQSYDVTALLLKFELNKNKSTPIIIDVHHDFFEHDAITNININTYLPFVNDNIAIRNFLENNGRLKPYQYIPGTRYFGAYAAYLQPIVENEFHIGNNDYIKGGVFDTKVGNNRSIQKRIDNRLEKKLAFHTYPEKDNELRALIGQNPQRKFIFVVSPYHWSARSTVTNFDTMLNYFQQLQKDFSNVIFIYLNTDNYSDILFKDTVHLNEAGAKVFSAQLKKELIIQGVLEN